MHTEYESELAERYAEALHKVAQKTGTVDQLASEAHALQGIVNRTGRLVEFLNAPHIADSEKVNVINRTLSRAISEPLQNLVKMLTLQNKATYLVDILDKFLLIVEHSRGIYKASILTAKPLEDELKIRLKDALEKFCGIKLDLSFHVEPEIIGGVVYHYEDRMIDASFRSELNRLKYLLETTSLSGARAARTGEKN
jgi:F-type H+-transporting ATPase subunit delta